MAKLLELIEKKHKTVNASIAGNEMTPTEVVVLKELYRIEKTSHLFLTDNLTGKIDISKDCIYSENMRQRDPGLL